MTQLEALQWRPKKRWTDKEKVAEFNYLRSLAISYVCSIQDSVKRGDYCDDDDRENYIFERVMDILGEEVWEVINTLV